MKEKVAMMGILPIVAWLLSPKGNIEVVAMLPCGTDTLMKRSGKTPL